MTELFLKISGDVHGVGFRFETNRVALRLKLKGFVRNTPENTVEILAQGEKIELEQLLFWINTNSPGRIEKVEADWRQPNKIFDNFVISD